MTSSRNRRRSRNKARDRTRLRKQHFSSGPRTGKTQRMVKAIEHAATAKEQKQIVLVTRHSALIEYLTGDVGINLDNVTLIKHATRRNVRGRDVIGNPPLFIASQARTVTNFSVRVPQELRGTGLTLEQIRRYIEEPETYIIQKIPTPKHIRDEITWESLRVGEDRD